MTYLAVCFCDVVIKVIVKTCVCFNLEFSCNFEDSVEMKEKATVQTKSTTRVSSSIVLMCLSAPPQHHHPPSGTFWSHDSRGLV